MTPVEDIKARMRAEALLRRAAAHRDGGPEAAEAVQRHFMAALGNGISLAPGAAISGYWPMRAELDIRPLLERLAGEGYVCALPVVGPRGTPLSFRRWRPGDELASAGFGTSEPAARAEPVTPAVLLTPLLAFDAAGGRLGYGAAYYDITLRALRRAGEAIAVGIAFEAQRIDAAPHEDHDEPIDWVITETGAHRCRPRGSSGEGKT
jgi:5-formyltetrahydrofolate cyclo-ligase